MRRWQQMTQRQRLVEQRATHARPVAFVADDADEEEWAPGTCVTGGGIASGLGIGSAMAMLEVAQQLPVEDDPPA